MVCVHSELQKYNAYSDRECKYFLANRVINDVPQLGSPACLMMKLPFLSSSVLSESNIFSSSTRNSRKYLLRWEVWEGEGRGEEILEAVWLLLFLIR